MIKDIILLVIGGIVTLIGALCYRRLTRKKPRLTWRMLPPVHLPSQQLTAFNLVIANQGNDCARNVHFVAQLPAHALVESLEVQPSEPAIRFSVMMKGAGSRIEVDFQSLPSGVDCVLSFLTRKSSPIDVNVSILADGNVVGENRRGLSEDTLDAIRTKMTLLHLSLMAVSLFAALGLTVWILSLRFSARDALLATEIGDVYYHAGLYDKALLAYSSIRTYRWFPVSDTLLYKLARAYSQQTNSVDSVRCLKELLQTTEGDVARLALTDTAFDHIRSTAAFQEFEGMIQKRVLPNN